MHVYILYFDQEIRFDPIRNKIGHSPRGELPLILFAVFGRKGGTPNMVNIRQPANEICVRNVR